MPGFGFSRTVATLAVAAATAPLPAQAPATPGRIIEYRGGRWFDGARFVETTMLVQGGVFRARGGGKPDSVVDLQGGYVVPPFGDAHQHLVEFDPRPTVTAHLADGIFYVKDQSNAPVLRRLLDRMLNQPTSLDFISANQGWTSPGGHPIEVIRRTPADGPFGAFVRDSLDPGLVMQVDSTADIDRRWAYFLSGKPDFVKIYLLRSEDYARLRQDPAAEGNRGMDPALVPEMVRRAHAAGLTVSAHVWTAADFRAAVEGGVDQIAHVPGGRSSNPAPFLLAEADAALAAARGVTVVTTVAQQRDSAITDQLLATQLGPNLRLLRKHKVSLLLGSDLFPATAAVEAAALKRSAIFSNLELLRMWSVTTPQAIFPQRKLGELKEGYEASFLVLRGDPLADFAQTRAIVMRVKRGLLLRP
jgi:hypothetical protein